MTTDKDAPVSSPCVDNCCLNEEDICMGCHRSLQEILLWGEANSVIRLEILQRVEERKEAK